MQSAENARFLPAEKNGEPEMITEQSQLERGYVEASNVDLANEMSRVIETQRAYQFAIRMIQTSDEIEGIVNSLR